MLRYLLPILLILFACDGRRRGGGGTTVLPRPMVDAGPRPSDAGCTPSCSGKECGDDGCGGTCGTCPMAAPFCVNATCEATCTPDCTGKECGDDGCGQSCGTCPMAAPNCVQNTRTAGCTPDCTGKVCGNDGCGGSCGSCQPGESCNGGSCAGPGGCVAGTLQCVDQFAYEACGLPDVAATDRSFGPRIPCWDDNTCASGSCNGPCGRPELLILVDRSSSMQGARWNYVSAALLAAGERNEDRADYAVRMFPSGGGCGVGPIRNINSPDDFIDALSPPNSDAQTPIAAALEGLIPSFGDPNQGQAVILITDGDETCAANTTEAVLRAEVLARSGIQVFVIGVSQAANPALMAAIAQAGGTGSHTAANDQTSVEAALDGVLTTLNACAAPPPPPPPMGAVGDPCVDASDCMGGLCLTTEFTTWPGGYCSQLCGGSGSPCPTGASCLPPIIGMEACIKDCIDVSDCRPSYDCAALPGLGNACFPN